ncbi:MAG: nucleoside-diphosphate kinase [Planctomycetaceae bacterium]|jgi:nucleoside-diphosphate kinase|nr:nucleoside-diphosphate kinase [Planctomycetaceae bacterium]
MERTLILLKPDAYQRGLIGEIVSRFEKKGFSIVELEMLRVTSELAKKHYADHVSKDFYPSLEAYITSAPIVAMVLEGTGVIASVRLMVGVTNSLEAAAGTIRGDYSTSKQQNLIHASDCPEAAAREITIFFPESKYK